MRLIEITCLLALAMNVQLSRCAWTGRYGFKIDCSITFQAPTLVKRPNYSYCRVFYRFQLIVVGSDSKSEGQAIRVRVVIVKVSITLAHHNVCFIKQYKFDALESTEEDD